MAKLNSLKAEGFAFLSRVARWEPLRPLVTLFFDHLEALLPGQRLFENTTWVALHHPSPCYPVHILLVPKRAVPSLLHAPQNDPAFYQGLFEAVRALITDFNLARCGYRLIINGGPNQTIPQMHCHLISESPPPGDPHA